MDTLTHTMWHVTNRDKAGQRRQIGEHLKKIPISPEHTHVILKRSCLFTNIDYLPILSDVQDIFPRTRFIISRCDPRSSASSMLRRGICTDIETAIAWTRQAFGHLHAELAKIGADNYRVFRYEDFIEHPTHLMPEMEDVLAFPHGSLAPALTLISRPTRESQALSDQHALVLDDTFQDLQFPD